eukprot:1160921-Pelagomonas_calceolata.AAC.16
MSAWCMEQCSMVALVWDTCFARGEEGMSSVQKGERAAEEGRAHAKQQNGHVFHMKQLQNNRTRGELAKSDREAATTST